MIRVGEKLVLSLWAEIMRSRRSDRSVGEERRPSPWPTTPSVTGEVDEVLATAAAAGARVEAGQALAPGAATAAISPIPTASAGRSPTILIRSAS